MAKYPAKYYTKCLTKMDYATTRGWWVRIHNPDGTIHKKLFSLSGRSWNGVKRIAIQYRNEYLQKIHGSDWLDVVCENQHRDTKGIPLRKLRTSRKNYSKRYKSGVIGVYYREDSDRWGANWIKWTGENRQPKTKTFAASIHGTTGAFLKACIERCEQTGSLVIVDPTKAPCSIDSINQSLQMNDLDPAIITDKSTRIEI